MINSKRLSRILLTIIVLFLFSIPAFAEISWQPANQATVSWNAVAKTSEGTDIPPEDTVKYKLYAVKSGDDLANAVEIGETDQLRYVITFEDEGRWLVGVSAYRVPTGSSDPDTDIRESSITWSNSVDIAAVPVPFGVIYFAAPAPVAGFGLE